MRHGGSAENVRYISRWYEYKHADDSVKLPEHISGHFNIFYLVQKAEEWRSAPMTWTSPGQQNREGTIVPGTGYITVMLKIKYRIIATDCLERDTVNGKPLKVMIWKLWLNNRPAVRYIGVANRDVVPYSMYDLEPPSTIVPGPMICL